MNQQNQEQNEKKYNYFYKITNLINGKYYYGIHSTNKLNDSYMGSGKIIKDAIEKYGRKNFIKEVIADYSTRKEASDHEKKIVTLEIIELEECYNLRTGGDNGHIPSQDLLNRMQGINKGIKRSPDFCQNLSVNRKGELNQFYGKHHTDETKKILSEKNTGYIPTPETIEKIKAAVAGKNIGRVVSKDTREKIRKSTIMANGIIYNSMSELGRAFDLTPAGAEYRIKSKSEKWKDWNFIKENINEK